MGKVLLAGNSKDRKIAMEGITPGVIKNHELNSLEAANDFLNRYLVFHGDASFLLGNFCLSCLRLTS